MSAILWDGRPFPLGLEYREVKRPEPPPGWILIRNLATGICGSDLHYLSGVMAHQVPQGNYPAILGHENAGEIVKIGEGVTGFSVGDRVAAEPLHPCRVFGGNICPACMAGHYHLCEQLSFVGIPVNHLLQGGYGEYSLYHSSCLFHLPDHIGYEQAALLDVLACGVHAANIGRPTTNDAVVVLGCGPIGLGAILVLRSMGVKDIVGVAKYPFQAEIAQVFGASVTVCVEEDSNILDQVRKLVGSADQVYECVGGNADTVQQGIEICRRGGKIIVLGFFNSFRSIDLEALFLNELSILAADGYSTFENQREFGLALGLMKNGLADIEGMITHSFPRSSWKQAIETTFDRKLHHSLKVMFKE